MFWKGSAIMLLVFLIVSGCASAPEESQWDPEAADFTLQLLHFADVDGSEEIALNAVDEFSAIVEAFKNDSAYGKATLMVSSGDNIIPGPRFYAAEQKAVRAVTGSNEPGHADVAFLNYFGVQASALGNHDLDASLGELADAMKAESKDDAEFPGAQFPYLAANLDWSAEEDALEIVGEDGAMAGELAGKLARYAVVPVGGEMIGLVGASTPVLDEITNVGRMKVLPENSRDPEDVAAEIQGAVDALTANGIDKIILLTHMQQIEVETAMAKHLSHVDIIVAGGSNTRMGDSTDTLFGSDDGFEMDYPYQTTDADGRPILVVNVDGDYKYLGRLVVSFDADGYILPRSLDETLNGAWASTAENAAALGGLPNPDLVKVRDAVQDVINAQYGNVLGFTKVYLEGRRSKVRTEETNLGNLSADANLWYANLMSGGTVDISIKNGGGLRTEIGSAVVPPGSTDYSETVYSAPLANREVGAPEGAVTEGHLRATLRFDNGLVVLNVTAQELKMLLEHGIAATAEGATPGRFPQVGGMRMAFDMAKPEGSRIQTLEVLNSDDRVKDLVVERGLLKGDANRVFRLVTLNFLANGGDDYPYDRLSDPQRHNLYEGKGYGEDVDYPDEDLSRDPGANSSFSYTGGEQDALAEYLGAFHGSAATGYGMEETARSEDQRIQY